MFDFGKSFKSTKPLYYILLPYLTCFSTTRKKWVFYDFVSYGTPQLPKVTNLKMSISGGISTKLIVKYKHFQYTHLINKLDAAQFIKWKRKCWKLLLQRVNICIQFRKAAGYWKLRGKFGHFWLWNQFSMHHIA